MSCACCGGRMAQTRYRAQLGGGRLVECCSCGHIQVASLPTAMELEHYYASKYSHARAAYVDKAYLAVMAKRAAAQCDFIECAGVKLKGATAIDIGCGYGALVRELAKRGATVSGYDYDAACVDYGVQQGLDVHRMRDEAELAELPRVDLVTLSHTLEHMRTVGENLVTLASRAQHVFIEVPRYSLGLREMFRDQEGHLHFFTPKSLQHLLERSPLRPRNVSTFGPELALFWRKRYAPVRRVWRALARDWFFNDYATERSGGMWIRALASS